MRRLARLAALGLAALALAPAQADRALLIGTGDYPALAPSLHLAAPDTDAHRLRDALVRAGLPPTDVTLMTDSEGTKPTRAAVLAQLAALARTAHSGERLLIYFSGHGAQAPALDPSAEPDGLDELYLMRDAARWDGGIARVPGSIRDAELAAAVRAIRMKGANVWFVADTCHAAGLTRGALPADARAKGVTAVDLGIPARRRTRSTRTANLAQREPPGAFAAFYAAGPGALALERRLPLGSPDARPLSQFSYVLARALDAGRVRSLRDLAIALNAADDMLGGGAPQPEFEGALDMDVLGLPADRPRRFAIERAPEGLRLAAGQEEGLRPGMRFVLVDPASGATRGDARAQAVAFGSSLLQADGPITPGALEAQPVAMPITVEAGGPALLAAAAPLAGQGAARDLQVTAALWRPGARRSCPALDPAGSSGAATRSIQLLGPPELGQCDVVLATVRNGGEKAVDLSPFYLDAGGRLVALSFLDGGEVRIAPGEQRRVAVRLLSEDRAGRPLAIGSERLLLLALPGTARVPVDLRGVAMPRALRSAPLELADADGAGALVYRWTVTAPPQR